MFKSKYLLKSPGYCPTCKKRTRFGAKKPDFREHLKCAHCRSIARERALIEVIDKYMPDWKDRIVHESSPANRGASVRLQEDCPGYISSQYFEGVPSGEWVDGVRCENLESLSLDESSIDLHVTQDVLEHVFHPEKVFFEIARTLAPGGMHIFTVPLVNRWKPSECRAKLSDAGEIIYLKEAEYHGNPVGDGRSLVTFDWGYDICEFIFKSCGLFTHTVLIDDLSRGIHGENLEVLVTVKPKQFSQL